MNDTSVPMVIGDVAKYFKRPTWMIRRLFEKGDLPEPRRVGLYRVFSAADLPTIESAMRQRGYLPAAVEAVGA